MATDIIARGMITEQKSGTNIDFKENEDGSVTISASGDVSSEDTVARDTIDNHKLDKNNPHNVTAEQIGLGNVDNTADLDKPISTAVQTALDDKANTKHTHKKSDITDFPNSLPANGGNADTVNGFGVAEYVTTLPEGEYYTEAARINTRDKKIESCDTSNLKVGLADYATNADYAMNANTVNNHTVDCDVPADAVFTDTTNSDVQASGNPVVMDNLQGGVPFSEISVSGDDIIGQELTVNVSGKNLLKYPYYDTTKTINGVTFTDNGDGSVLVNGTATKNVYFNLNSNKAFPAGKYVLSKSRDNVLIYIDKYLDNVFYQRIATSIETVRELIFNVSEDDAQKYTYRFGIQLNKDNIADNVTIYPQLELGDTATSYEPYHGSTITITPTSNPYTIPDSIEQQDGLNVVSVSEGEISVTGVRKNAAVKKIWDEIGMDLLFDGTVTTGTNCITENINGYNFLYFYGNLSSVSGESGNVTGSLVIPKTARAISAGQSLVVTTGVIYITVNIINIESGVITFTVTPSDSNREIYEFKVFGIK